MGSAATTTTTKRKSTWETATTATTIGSPTGIDQAAVNIFQGGRNFKGLGVNQRTNNPSLGNSVALALTQVQSFFKQFLDAQHVERTGAKQQGIACRICYHPNAVG